MNQYPSFTFMNITDALLTVFVIADVTIYPSIANQYVSSFNILISYSINYSTYII